MESCHQNASSCQPGACSLPCTAHAAEGPIVLAEALARFQREAQHGVCATGRYRMPYFSWGAGPPLVFVHGAADTARSFLLPISRLCASFRCVAYDLPSGKDDGARLGRYRHAHLVEDLLALVDHLGVSRAYLFGASFGATVVLRALARTPDRFPRAILQGGTAYRPLRRAEWWVAMIARWLIGPMARLPKREKVLTAVHRAPFAHQPEEVWQAFLTTTGQARIRALGHQAKWLHQIDLRAELANIRQPVLLIHGERDSVMPLRHAEVLRQGLPSSGLAVLPEAGHVPAYTHPEALAELVRSFLTPPGPACPGPTECPEAKEECSSQGNCRGRS